MLLKILTLIVVLIFPSINVKEIGHGVASYYSLSHHRTADGEIFNKYALTAASRTLPFDDMVLVRNEENERTVQVRITDRGPYRRHRIIDLSYAAAKQIGILKQGVHNVKIYEIN